MPLINHIRGEQVPDAMLTVRTPIVRIPWWLTIPWWSLRGLFRLVVAYLRFWYATIPATLLVWLFVEYGWIGPVLAVPIPTGALWLVAGSSGVVPAVRGAAGARAVAAVHLPPGLAPGHGNRRTRGHLRRADRVAGHAQGPLHLHRGCRHGADGDRADSGRLQQGLRAVGAHVRRSGLLGVPRGSSGTRHPDVPPLGSPRVDRAPAARGCGSGLHRVAGRDCGKTAGPTSCGCSVPRS